MSDRSRARLNIAGSPPVCALPLIVAANPAASKRVEAAARHGAVVNDRSHRDVLEADAERLEQRDRRPSRCARGPAMISCSGFTLFQSSLPALVRSMNSPASIFACSTSSVTRSEARSTISASISRRLAALAPMPHDMRAGLEPGVLHHRLGRIGGGDDDVGARAPHPPPKRRRAPARRVSLASLAQKVSSLPRSRARHGELVEHADRLERQRLRARLPAGADQRDLAGARARHLLGRDAARRAGADLAESVGLDDRQQALGPDRAARGKRRRAVGLHRITLLRCAIAAAHHVEPLVAERPARARHDVGLPFGAAANASRNAWMRRRHVEEFGDVGFFHIDRRWHSIPATSWPTCLSISLDVGP